MRGRQWESLRNLLILLALLPLAVTAQADEGAGPVAAGMVEKPCPADIGKTWALDPTVLKNDWAWRCRFAEENKVWNAGHPAKAVFIGDSISEGWVRADSSFFKNGVVGRGLSGQTSPQLLVRFWQDVVALHPRVVHIMIGTNDVAGNTGPTSPEDYRNAIRSMVAIARSNNISVVLASIPPADRFDWQPSLAPAARIVELNDWLRNFAKEEHLVFADYHSALSTKDGGLRPEFGKDGVHPDAAGYAVMRPIAERAIEHAMQQPRQKRR